MKKPQLPCRTALHICATDGQADNGPAAAPKRLQQLLLWLWQLVVAAASILPGCHDLTNAAAAIFLHAASLSQAGSLLTGWVAGSAHRVILTSLQPWSRQQRCSDFYESWKM